MSDPFAALGLPPTASPAEVRAARRELAKRHHPDVGGDDGHMQRLNEAATSALRLIDQAASTPESPTWNGGDRDIPSFTVEALPVDTFEALLIATSAIGEVIDDDPPYALDVLLTDPLSCWCRLDLVPDAGASTVSITIGAVDGGTSPTTEQVRDLWIAQLNALDW